MVLKEVKLPPKSKKLAELVGIILGDGNVHKFIGKKSTSYMVRIAGDSVKDKEYLINYVKPLCDGLFGIESQVHKHKIHNEMFINLNSKLIVEFFESMGLTCGNKIINQITIPNWISTDSSFLKACIRGLVDTDGSLYELKPHWPGLWQICFTNKNQQLMGDFRDSLIKLGIKCSNIYNYPDGVKASKVYITKRSELRKFYKEIGFSNPKHQNKL